MRNEIKTTVKYYFITIIMAKRESMKKKSGKKEGRQAGGRQGGRKEGRKKSKRNDEGAGHVEPLELELSHFARRNAN